MASDKFDNPASSVALAANIFGCFLDHPGEIPPLPGCDGATWPKQTLRLEATLRFPWSGGGQPSGSGLRHRDAHNPDRRGIEKR